MHDGIKTVEGVQFIGSRNPEKDAKGHHLPQAGQGNLRKSNEKLKKHKLNYFAEVLNAKETNIHYKPLCTFQEISSTKNTLFLN